MTRRQIKIPSTLLKNIRRAGLCPDEETDHPGVLRLLDGDILSVQGPIPEIEGWFVENCTNWVGQHLEEVRDTSVAA